MVTVGLVSKINFLKFQNQQKVIIDMRGDIEFFHYHNKGYSLIES